MSRQTCITIFILFMQVFCFAQTPHFNFQALDFPAGATQSFTVYKLNSSCNGSSIVMISIKQGKKPVFCRMEDKIYKRCNVWILFRAGSDDEYRKLTRK